MVAKSKSGGGPKAGEVMRGTLGGTVSTGKKACGVRLVIPRSQIKLSEADSLLVEACLSVRMQSVMSDEAEAEKSGQVLMWDDLAPNDHRIETEADCSSLTTDKASVSCSLRFGAGDAELVQSLINMRGAEVQVCLAKLGDAGQADPDEAE